jgi:hypothetical protein
MTTEPMKSRADELLRRARAKAATLGAFNPAALLDPSRNDELAALDALAAQCDEVVQDKKPLWILQPDVRMEALRELRGGELGDVLSSVQPTQADQLGGMLRRALLGKQAPGAQAEMNDLGLWRTALHFAAAARDTDKEVREVDRLLIRRDAEEATQSLVPGRLVGRNTQLTKLQRFVNERAGIAAEDIMWVIGAGGSGKSALLATFANSLRRAGKPLVQLDFDRPSLFNGSLATLMMEVSRLLVVDLPHLEPKLLEYRKRARSFEAEPSSRAQFEQRQARTHGSESAWLDIMAPYLPIHDDVVMILDTAEEVGLSGEFDLEALRRWLRELRTRNGLPNLKAVICGRAFEDDQLALVPSSRLIDLGDLKAGPSVTLLCMFLEHQDVNVPMPLDDLVGLVGGNPLALRILASYLADAEEPPEQAAQALLSDRRGFDRRFAQSFLYKRILKRLRNASEDLQKLAHPGLVLRRVTPQLIAHVMARPCMLSAVDETHARELFRQLARQVWLVQRTTNPDVVIHRRDLRRLMLQAMTAEDEETAMAIHAGAATYYSGRLDPSLGPREQWVEAAYHRLFLPAQAPHDPSDARMLARALGEDIESAPVVARAELKLAAGRKLTPAEQQALSRDEQALYESTQNRIDVAMRGTALAATVPRAVTAPGSGLDVRVAVSQVHAAFDQGDLLAAASRTTSAVSEFIGFSPETDSYSRSEDFTQSAVWRCGISTLGKEPDLFLSELLETALRIRNMHGWNSSASSPWMRRLSQANAWQMLFRLHGADCPQDMLPWRLGEPSSRLESTHDLRNLQLRDKQLGEYAQVPVGMLRDLSPQFMAYFMGPDAQSRKWIEPDKSAVMALKQIDQLSRGMGTVALSELREFEKGTIFVYDMQQVNAEGKDLLVGRLPEIHPLVRAAARACKLETIFAFAAKASRDHPGWPVELSNYRFRQRLLEQREQWTATLIDCTDRFGLLRELLDWMEDRNKLAARHRQLLKVVRAYELRLRQFL